MLTFDRHRRNCESIDAIPGSAYLWRTFEVLYKYEDLWRAFVRFSMRVQFQATSAAIVEIWIKWLIDADVSDSNHPSSICSFLSVSRSLALGCGHASGTDRGTGARVYDGRLWSMEYVHRRLEAESTHHSARPLIHKTRILRSNGSQTIHHRRRCLFIWRSGVCLTHLVSRSHPLQLVMVEDFRLNKRNDTLVPLLDSWSLVAYGMSSLLLLLHPSDSASSSIF